MTISPFLLPHFTKNFEKFVKGSTVPTPLDFKHQLFFKYLQSGRKAIERPKNSKLKTVRFIDAPCIDVIRKVFVSFENGTQSSPMDQNFKFSCKDFT